MIDNISSYKQLVERSASLTGIATHDGQVSSLSPAWARQFESAINRLLSEPVFNLFHRDDAAKFRKLLVQSSNRGDTFQFTGRFGASPDEFLWLSWNAIRLSDDTFYFNVEDITAERQKQFERNAIATSFETHAIIAVTDPRGRIVEVNDEFCRISGYSSDELLGQTHALINSGHHSRDFFKTMWRTIAEANIWRGEICNRSKSGRLYWVDTTITPVRGPSGKVQKYIAVRHDITERKLIDEKMRREARLFSEVADVSGVGAWEFDLETEILYWDDQTRKIHEVDNEFVPDLSSAIGFYAPEAQVIVSEAVENAIKTGDAWSLELPLVTATGRNIWVRAAGRVLTREDKPVQLVGAFQEITLRKEHSEVMSRMRDRAFAANTAKTEFLSTVSHEIRTPLHGILGMAQLLGGTSLSNDQSDWVDAIRKSGRSLLRIVNDILDISRIESGRMPLALEWDSPNKILQEIATSLDASDLATDVSISVTTEWPDTAEAKLDASRFRQIINNLVGNAVKFSPGGEVTVVLSQPGEKLLEISVADTGIGISNEDQGRIFDRFTRVDSAMHRETDGSGLGLSVVHDLVELMGGKISLQSQIDQGSAFTVTLPVQVRTVETVAPGANRLASNAPAVKKNYRSKRALVVDDVAINRMVCSALLKEVGFDIADCESGQEALTLMDNEDFDIVFMDLHMPNMSGDKCITAIRASNKSYANIPIIVLTADVSDRARELVIAAGANDICYKPFQLSQITGLFDRIFQVPDKPSTPQRVILIDDDPSEFTLLENRFSSDDIDLKYYNSLDLFLASGPNARAEDIILLDGRMPPISSHDESLALLQEAGCAAAILLLSNDRFVEHSAFPDLNIVGVRDKVELLKAGSAGLLDPIAATAG